MSTLRLETIAMNTFIGEDSDIYIKIGNNFAQKKGRDVQPGDLVVIEKEYIQKSMADVIPFLEESIRYKNAKSGVLQKNEMAQEIPKLRILLLEGLLGDEAINYQNEIMKQGIDFTTTMYEQFNNNIKEYVIGLHEQTTMNWLKGTTLAPQDMNVFQNLVAINPKFNELLESKGKDHGFHNDYSTYVGTHKVVMRYLSKQLAPKENTEVPKQSTSLQDHAKWESTRNYAPEISLVVSHFLSEINDNITAARVTGVYPISKSEVHEAKTKNSPSPQLRKGIYTGKLESTISINEISAAYYLIRTAFIDIGARFLELTNDPLTEKRYFPKITYKNEDMFQHAISASLCKKYLKETAFINRINDVTVNRLSMEDKTRIQEYELLFDKEMRAGTLDTKLGFESHTMANMIDVLNDYHSALPKALFVLEEVTSEYNDVQQTILIGRKNNKLHINEKILFKQAQSLGKNKTAVETYLNQHYNYDNNSKSIFPIYLEYQNSIKTAPPEILTIDILEEEKKQAIANGITFYTQEDINQIFAKAGIPSAKKILDKTTFFVKDADYKDYSSYRYK